MLNSKFEKKSIVSEFNCYVFHILSSIRYCMKVRRNTADFRRKAVIYRYLCINPQAAGG